MSSSVTADASGVVTALRAIDAALEDQSDALADVAAAAAAELAEHTPVKGGRLRGNVRPYHDSSTAGATNTTVYAGPIYYGWPRRGIRSSHAIDRTDAAMETRAVDLLEAGFAATLTKEGLT